MSTLLAVPNVSEGRNRTVIDAIARAFGPGLLDVHADPDHNRAVFTIAGRPGELAHRVAAGARETVKHVDLTRHEGLHPRVGALDVAPIVHLTPQTRGAALAEALVLADLLAETANLPVFLYGSLAGGRTRAELRAGGPEALSARIDGGELVPDFGPDHLRPTAGAVLVAARPPLLAFNVELAPPATLQDAQRIAGAIRASADTGLRSVRAIGLWLTHRNIAQVSMNIEDHRATPLATIIDAITEQAPIDQAELVGLAPRAAFDAFPNDIPVRNRRTIEDALASTH